MRGDLCGPLGRRQVFPAYLDFAHALRLKAGGEMETAPFAGLGFQPDFAAEESNQSRADGEAESSSSIFARGRVIRLREGFKDPLLRFGRHAYPRVDHGKLKLGSPYALPYCGKASLMLPASVNLRALVSRFKST